VASIVRRMDAYRSGLALLCAATALAAPSVALAQAPPMITHAPEIQGTPVVGETLRAVNGTWSGSQNAGENYTWRRCADQVFEDCSTIPGATGTVYALTSADAGNFIRVSLTVSLGDDSDSRTSDPTAVVSSSPAASATPTPTPGSPATTAPSFNPAAPVTPSATAPTAAKLIRPRPTVRISGRYTKAGATIRVFTVKSPAGTKVKVVCRKSCPAKSQSLKAGRTAHATKFERKLKSGTKLTVTVSRPGYLSRVTTLTIRARRAPRRSDACQVLGRTTTQRCPAG